MWSTADADALQLVLCVYCFVMASGYSSEWVGGKRVIGPVRTGSTQQVPDKLRAGDTLSLIVTALPPSVIVYLRCVNTRSTALIRLSVCQLVFVHTVPLHSKICLLEWSHNKIQCELRSRENSSAAYFTFRKHHVVLVSFYFSVGSCFSASPHSGKEL